MFRYGGRRATNVDGHNGEHSKHYGLENPKHLPAISDWENSHIGYRQRKCCNPAPDKTPGAPSCYTPAH